MVRKHGGRRPKASTFPLGPSQKETPLPETWGPETRLRIQAPGASATSRSLPRLASCSSPLPASPSPSLSSAPSVLLGTGSRHPSHPPISNPRKGPSLLSRACGGNWIHVCQTKGGEKTCGSPQPVRCWCSWLSPSTGLEPARDTRGSRSWPVSVSPTAPPERAGISCGGRSYGPEDTPDKGCCRSPDFAHRTASQRRFVGWSIPGRALETGRRMEEDALFSGNKNSTFL
ncbi:uncharacterized protein LOC125098956 [Lutra lutra]|uniref:uncharacterized protein LOC125098956 n=1 Tax=Lutra lutra TaxID=9657 RepID=UPI001FCFC58C|nr:uncharacterized protein LOC125098956 [Lutra lutra]